MKVHVRSSDSLLYYSQLFRLPLHLLLDSNPGVNPEKLVVGQEIKIPGFITFPYKVQKGDNLWKIAQSKNVNVDSINLVNQSINPKQLTVGETIMVPMKLLSPVVNGKEKYDFTAISRDVLKLSQVYPFIRVNTIGASVLGLPLIEVKIGAGPKKIHMNAAFHANEWITTPILMTFLDLYLLSLTNGLTIRGMKMMPFYRSVELSIVPMVNPDGVNLVLNGPPEAVRAEVLTINGGNQDFSGWKANIRGVDLNNQFPANWEIEKKRKEPKSPAPRDYPGDNPLSEPEVIAMACLAKENRFDRVVALHTQGEEFYWGYEGDEPVQSERTAKEFERVSGYKAVQYIDSHAGFKDWYIQEFRKEGYTLELGSGENPLPISQFDDIYQKTLPIFLAALYM